MSDADPPTMGSNNSSEDQTTTTTIISPSSYDHAKSPQNEEEVVRPTIEGFEHLENDATPYDPFHYTNDDDQDSTTESLPPTEEPHDRSDGSDSGLGSELAEERRQDMPVSSTTSLEETANDGTITFLDKINTLELPVNDTVEKTDTKLENDIDDILDVPPLKRSNLKHKPLDDDIEDQPKCKKKRGISFDSVTVYYFPRAQGFTCIPSQGGSTLGMATQHSYVRKFSITEHANEQRRIHRQFLQQLRSQRAYLNNGGAQTTNTNNPTTAAPASTSGTSSDESEEEASDGSDNEMDLDNYYFLQPVPIRQRRALLRAAGVHKIDSVERDECRDIRTSREFCGCGCKGYCDPDTCTCSQAGIKCQVDRLNFPCGCSRDNCANSSGRIEFNPMRVRTHFIHTLMRLELEKKQEKEEEEDEEVKNKAGDWMENERLNADYKEKRQNEKGGKFGMGSLLRKEDESTSERQENCGSFTNLHYGAPGEGPGPNLSTGFADLPAREDSLDLYTFREDCYENQRENERKTPSTQQLVPYQSPPPNFHFSDPRFVDVPFPNPSYHHATTNQYAASTTQSYQSNLADFFFTAYGGNNAAPGYGTDFATTKDTSFQSSQQTPSTQQQETNTYNNFENETFVSKENQYTSLNPVGNNKIVSFSDLLNGRYNYGGCYEENSSNFSELNTTSTQNTVGDNGNENINNKNANEDCCDVNFGEIIKKSMVDTTST